MLKSLNKLELESKEGGTTTRWILEMVTASSESPGVEVEAME